MVYLADVKKNEYFHVYINDQDATTGPSEISLNETKLIRLNC